MFKLLYNIFTRVFGESIKVNKYNNSQPKKQIVERKIPLISQPKIYKEVYLKVYISKKYRELKKDDELDIKKLIKKK